FGATSSRESHARPDTPTSPSPKVYAFVNGQWYDGKTFRPQTFYAVNGKLETRKPATIDETIDLQNGYVIPPFGDAHTHNLDGVRGLQEMTNAYLREGTLYVQVLGNYSTGAKEARPLLNQLGTLDVSYANGMLTCTYGHPFMVYEPMAMGIYDYKEANRKIAEVKKSRRGENNVYWFLDSKADVDAKWDAILATRPDVIKIALQDAVNHKKYVAAGDTVGKGLSPEVAEYVVIKARKAGLRVFAHIDTAGDFRLGLKIGVDGFAHAPYCNWNGATDTKPLDDLTAEDIKRAGAKKMIVIPTAQISTFATTDYAPDGKGTLNPARAARVIERHKRLLNEMHRNGVRIALGLDNYGKTLLPEIEYLYDKKILDNATILKIAVETTPQAIFPGRKIGKLQSGYEASFLVIAGDPLTDMNQIKNIQRMFKRGVPLSTDAKKPSP
ncbi:MAG: amidohydrolase family protein, partial [Armatimonadetes bacterium]|nr:amidohydrolase family protein [Armatimonadota bacterium]